MIAKMLMLSLVMPCEAMLTPRRLTARADAPRISAGYEHSCGIRADNSRAECWGYNYYGQSTVSPDVPYTHISAGWDHTCGIRADNSLAECWGNNGWGNTAVAPDVLTTILKSPRRLRV